MRIRLRDIETFFVRATTLLVVAAFFTTSCAPKSEGVSTQCVVNTDQSSLFKGHWTFQPIPLAVVVTDFNQTELQAIEAAIQTWNTFFTQSKGVSLYLENSSSSAILAEVSQGGTRITSATTCTQTVVNNNGFTKQIMIYKNASGWTYGNSIMALTSLCPVTTGTSEFRMFTSAVMEINFVNFFNIGQPVPDLQSIVTHELGHMLGLDHSCVGTGCSGASADYTNAVMYPTLGFIGINGQVKRALQTNDEHRANCLY